MLKLQRVTQRVVERAPDIIRTMINITPDLVLKSILNKAINEAFRRNIDLGDLEFMRNKTVQINVSDLGFLFAVRLTRNNLQVVLNSFGEDASFQATSSDLLLLIAGKIDPDTLFFRRRLKISGDTELALALKNFLDTIDPSTIFSRRLFDWLNRFADGIDKQIPAT